jgi:hypothetical protein
MRHRLLLLWVPAALLAMLVLVAVSGMRAAARAAREQRSTACRVRAIDADLDGDGRLEQVKIVRYDGDAWADVWQDGSLRSSTRLGEWRDDAELDAIDVNGDGRMDLVRRWSRGTQHLAQVWLSDGVAFDAGWTGVTSATCVAQR